MEVRIPNRYRTESLTVSAMTKSSDGPCVAIGAFAGQMTFHHFMTPDQARQMAAALLAAAETIEAGKAPATEG